MEILNLYAGIGGNRKHWAGHNVTAVEYTPEIAEVYQSQHPNDKVVIGDAHQYLLENHQRFDFIWSSPPCQSHSKMQKAGRNRSPRYPDFKLYEEIWLLQNEFKGLFVVENVVPYYKPLIEPTVRVGRHLFWTNFSVQVTDVERPEGFIRLQNLDQKKQLMDWLGIHYEKNIYYDGNHCPSQILRNCVHPLIGKQILDQAEESLKQAA